MRSLLFLILVAMLGLWPGRAGADLIPGLAGAGFTRMPVKSLAEMRFANMIKQKYDFSCGAAAIASLLTYHYNQPVDEAEVLKAMYEVGDKEKIEKVGFSMLDMKKYLQSQGLKAEGFRAPLDKLASASVPALVLINNKGYMHFVIVKGITAEHILLGDPASGTRIMRRDDFAEMWNGILFVVMDKMDMARESFNLASDWNRNAKPQAGSLYSGSLSNLAIDAATTPNYY